jgi:heat shock protein HslJ
MKKLFAIVSMVAVMGAGCAASSPASPSLPTDNGNLKPAPKMSMAQFMTGSWKFKSMQMVGGQAQDVSSLNLTVNFDGEKMSGKVCNSMNGPYTVEDNLVKFGAIAQTKMFCEGLPGEVEAAFSSGFKNNYTISKQGDNLVMMGAAVFVLERQGASGTEDGKVY